MIRPDLQQLEIEISPAVAGESVAFRATFSEYHPVYDRKSIADYVYARTAKQTALIKIESAPQGGALDIGAAHVFRFTCEGVRRDPFACAATVLTHLEERVQQDVRANEKVTVFSPAEGTH